MSIADFFVENGSTICGIIAAISELLPLLGFTEFNGILHAIKVLGCRLHGDSDCHVDVALDSPQRPSAPPPSTNPMPGPLALEREKIVDKVVI